VGGVPAAPTSNVSELGPDAAAVNVLNLGEADTPAGEARDRRHGANQQRRRCRVHGRATGHSWQRRVMCVNVKRFQFHP